jgi:single-strand DNA-binding protein
VAEDYVRKGDRLYVEGRIEYDSFEKNGVTIPTTDVQVRELVLLSPANGRSRPAAAMADADEEE